MRCREPVETLRLSREDFEAGFLSKSGEALGEKETALKQSLGFIQMVRGAPDDCNVRNGRNVHHVRKVRHVCDVRHVCSMHTCTVHTLCNVRTVCERSRIRSSSQLNTTIKYHN